MCGLMSARVCTFPGISYHAHVLPRMHSPFQWSLCPRHVCNMKQKLCCSLKHFRRSGCVVLLLTYCVYPAAPFVIVKSAHGFSAAAGYHNSRVKVSRVHPPVSKVLLSFLSELCRPICISRPHVSQSLQTLSELKSHPSDLSYEA